MYLHHHAAGASGREGVQHLALRPDVRRLAAPTTGVLGGGFQIKPGNEYAHDTVLLIKAMS